MDKLALIVVLSIVIWHLVEIAKKNFWDQYTWGKYVTLVVAGIAGFGVTFMYNLDLIYALGFATEMNLAGQIITGCALAAGSGVVSEIIERIKNVGGNRDSL